MKPDNGAKARAVFAKALPRITPSRREAAECFATAAAMAKKLERVLPPAVEVRLAGSLAKGTALAGNNEFDIFMLFPRHYSHHEMTMMGMQYARRAFAGMRVEARYAEHPYLQVFYRDYHADIVPAYRIERISERGSSVDRSQLHTAYINAKLDAAAKGDVRLLKRFMKNFGIYGAELRVEGFSGYLCELLIVHHGSLFSLMSAVSQWHAPVVDTEKHLSEDAARRKFPQAPLIVVDPTDPNRNVAAVVAHTSLSRFIFECRRFLAAPSEKFFFAKKTVRSPREIARAMKERGTMCLAVRFPAPKVVPDVLWPQLRKTAQALSRRLSEQGFSVFGSYHWSDGAECAVLFEIDRWELPAVAKAIGPSVRFARDCESFVKKHKSALNMHIEHDRMVAVEIRKVRQARAALLHACRHPHGAGIPGNMEHAMARCEVAGAERLLSKKYAEFLSDYFFAKIA
ncbi:MAG: CCA tRNA nucleotidyltransferase [Candidatus Micrarchaeia archaeon]|jgi:tRNA nucleotidyltransferase (CCA-adding enzyme)